LIEPANMPEPHVTGTVRGTGPRAPAVLGGRAASPVVELVAGGLGAYWAQFPELLPQLKSSVAFVSSRLQTRELLAAGQGPGLGRPGRVARGRIGDGVTNW
jgi:hypothetical protein